MASDLGGWKVRYGCVDGSVVGEMGFSGGGMNVPACGEITECWVHKGA